MILNEFEIEELSKDVTDQVSVRLARDARAFVELNKRKGISVTGLINDLVLERMARTRRADMELYLPKDTMQTEEQSSGEPEPA